MLRYAGYKEVNGNGIIKRNAFLNARKFPLECSVDRRDLIDLEHIRNQVIQRNKKGLCFLKVHEIEENSRKPEKVTCLAKYCPTSSNIAHSIIDITSHVFEGTDCSSRETMTIEQWDLVEQVADFLSNISKGKRLPPDKSTWDEELSSILEHFKKSNDEL